VTTPDQPTAAPCWARWPSTSRDPNTRIVHCDLPSGHDGDHCETDTESTWPACCPGESFRGDPHGMHTHDCPTYLASMAAFEQRTTVLSPTEQAAFDQRFRELMAGPQRWEVLQPSESEREQAAYERGVAEGRAKAAAFIANEIRAELVCCEIYQHAHGDEERVEQAERSGHAICFWGEAAARIAVGRDDAEEAPDA
jgi:hypothetical protein